MKGWMCPPCSKQLEKNLSLPKLFIALLFYQHQHQGSHTRFTLNAEICTEVAALWFTVEVCTTVHRSFCSAAFHSHADNPIYFSKSKINFHCPPVHYNKPSLPRFTRSLKPVGLWHLRPLPRIRVPFTAYHSVAYPRVCVFHLSLIQDAENYNTHKNDWICHSRCFIFNNGKNLCTLHSEPDSLQQTFKKRYYS